MYTKMKPLIGMKAGVEAIQNICDHSHIYHRCGLKPPHYVVSIDGGNGQTTFTTYVAEEYSDNEIIHFGGLDKFLEFNLDGSMSQLQKVFAEIQGSAVYTNEYEGIVAMDISKLADHINEFQIDYFINEIIKISNSSTCIFYVPYILNHNVVSLIGKLMGALEEISILNIQPYTYDEIVQIIKAIVMDAGIMIEDNEEIDMKLLDIVTENGISTVKAAKDISRRMIKLANFENQSPQISIWEIRDASLQVDCIKII